MAGDGVGVVVVVVEDEWHASINMPPFSNFSVIGNHLGSSVTLEPPIRTLILILTTHLSSQKNHDSVDSIYMYSISQN